MDNLYLGHEGIKKRKVAAFAFMTTMLLCMGIAITLHFRSRRRRDDDGDGDGDGDDSVALGKLALLINDLGDMVEKSKSMEINLLEEKLLQLDDSLCSVEGITEDELRKAHRLFAQMPNLVLVFSGVDPEERLPWLRALCPHFDGELW